MGRDGFSSREKRERLRTRVYNSFHFLLSYNIEGKEGRIGERKNE